jgi:hypothetical protein
VEVGVCTTDPTPDACPKSFYDPQSLSLVTKEGLVDRLCVDGVTSTPEVKEGETV